MKIFTSFEKKDINDKVAYAIGTFDGFHIGHKNVIYEMKKIAKENNLKTGIIAFSNIPRNIYKDIKEKNIYGLEQKIDWVKEQEIDYFILLEFSDIIKNIEKSNFINLVKEYFNLSAVIVGYNFKFGYGAEGNAFWLKEHEKEFDIIVSIVEAIKDFEGTISSSRIREYLKNGDVENANRLLGRIFSISSIVIYGKQNGRKLNFRTANFNILEDDNVLKTGVYITKTVLNDGRVFDSVTNVGYNPTFEGKNLSIETHIFNFDEDIYNQKISVNFYKMIRNEIKFDSIEELKNRIFLDCEIAKEFFENNKKK